MKSFKKYSHIENSYQTEYIEKVLSVVGENALFVAQEKVDGTNFQFIVGRNENGVIDVSCGKRSAELDPNENFYGWQNLVGINQEKVINLFEMLEESGYDVSEGVNLNGEFFGGHYPGFTKTEGAILNRIYYSPKREFYGYDIYIPTVGYLPPITALAYYKDAGFFCAENLFVGTLKECLKLNPVFESTIATRLGYDKVENNLAEGYVLKPVEPAYFGNGERIIIKHKNPKFQEVQKSRKVPKAPVETSDALKSLLASVLDYVNVQRLENCRSHLGEISLPKDFGKLLGEFSKDTIQEFIESSDNKSAFDALEKSEQKMFNGEVNKNCASLIKDTYMSVKI